MFLQIKNAFFFVYLVILSKLFYLYIVIKFFTIMYVNIQKN